MSLAQMWTKTKVPAIPRHAQQCTDDLQLIQVNYFSKPWQCFGLHFLTQEAESRNTSYSKLIVKHFWEGCRTLTCLLNYSPSALTISPFFLIARVSMVSWGRWSPMGFSRQEYWSGLPFPSPVDLPNPGIKPWSPVQQAACIAGGFLTNWATQDTLLITKSTPF